MLGVHGSYYANKTVQESDLLIAIGMRFDDRVTGRVDGFAPKAKIIHVDIDPTSIRKNVRVDIPVVGDVGRVLTQLNKAIKEVDAEPWNEARKLWLKQIRDWQKDFPLTYKNSDSVIKPQFVIEKIYELTKGKAFTTEVGQNQMWAAQFYKFDEPRFLLLRQAVWVVMGFGFTSSHRGAGSMP